MKIRSGFVSNSSSSSYVLIASEEQYKRLMDKIHPLAKHIGDQLGWQSNKLDGQPLKTLSWWGGNLNSLEWIEIPDDLIRQYMKDIGRDASNEDDLYEDDLYDTPHDCWGDFRDVAKQEGCCLVVSHDS